MLNSPPKFPQNHFFADKSLYSLYHQLKVKVMIISADQGRQNERAKEEVADSLPKVRNIPIAQMVLQLNSVQAFSKGKDFSLPNCAYFLNWLRHRLHLYLKIEIFSNTFKMSRFTIVYNPLLALTFVVVYWSIGLHHTYSL